MLKNNLFKIIVVTINFFIAISTTYAEDNNFTIQFGQLSMVGTPKITEETTLIPFRPVKPAPDGSADFFGYIIETSDKNEFTSYNRMYFPNPINGKKYLEGKKSFHNKERLVYWFHAEEGDPLGSYKVEVYINDVLFKIITFELVLDNKTPPQ